MALTRVKQVKELIYVCPDEKAFWSPDGEGRYWYDSLEEARVEHPLGDAAPACFLHEKPEDW